MNDNNCNKENIKMKISQLHNNDKSLVVSDRDIDDS